MGIEHKTQAVPTYLSDKYWSRMTQQEQLEQLATKARIRFTRNGWRQLRQVRALPGSTFAKAMTMKFELALYIAAHEEKNIHFDTDCEEITYTNGVTLLIHKESGIWYITDVIGGEEVTYKPVFGWKQLKRGCDIILAHVLLGWRKPRLCESMI